MPITPEMARDVVSAEMEARGAELVNGKWFFNGEPVTLIFLIRTEDNRRPVGDYFGAQLESIGFTVDLQYKNRTEASPIWNQSDPAEGLWNLYTAGWLSPSIDRDEGDLFSAYFTNRGSAGPLWQAYAPVPEFDAAALALESNNFQSLEERRELFATALRLSMEESYHVWVVDEASFSPRVNNLSVASDLAEIDGLRPAPARRPGARFHHWFASKPAGFAKGLSLRAALSVTLREM